MQTSAEIISNPSEALAGAFHADCRKTFEELKAKGMEFISEPKDQFYGVEAVFKDPFGNCLTQPNRSASYSFER